jgi:hypothetical protein
MPDTASAWRRCRTKISQVILRDIDFRHLWSPSRFSKDRLLSSMASPAGRVVTTSLPRGTSADALGIYPVGREAVRYQAGAPISALKSQAAPVVDTWSVLGEAHPASGGGTQHFVPDPMQFLRKP